MTLLTIAEHKLLGSQTEPRLVKKNKILIHTMVGTLRGTDSMFRQAGFDGTESHFGTSAIGEIWQWQDTDFQADANLEGNDDAISIENEDWGINGWKGVGEVPPFAPDQLKALIRLCAAICVEHDIPPVALTNSEDASRGIGTHRLGIDPYRTHGEHYSSSFAKACPGNARLNQVNTIVIPDTAKLVRSLLEPIHKTPNITKALKENAEYRAALRSIDNKRPIVMENVERMRRRAYHDFKTLKSFEIIA